MTARQARDARLGTSLGRLAYQELISSAQYDAGRQFAELYQRHHLTLGMPVPHPRSLAGLMITAGIVGESSAEPDDDLIAKLRDRFNAAPTPSMTAIGPLGWSEAANRRCCCTASSASTRTRRCGRPAISAICASRSTRWSSFGREIEMAG